MSNIQSYKFTSRLITLLGAVFVYLSTLTIEQVEHVLPPEYAYLAPLIVIIIGFGAAQLSEEKRIETAREIFNEKYEEKCSELDSNEEGCWSARTKPKTERGEVRFRSRTPKPIPSFAEQ